MTRGRETLPYQSSYLLRTILLLTILSTILPILSAFSILVSPTSLCGEYVILLNTTPNETLQPPVILGDRQANDTSVYEEILIQDTPRTRRILETSHTPSMLLYLPLIHATPDILEDLLPRLPQGVYTISRTSGRIGNGLNDKTDQIRVQTNTTYTAYTYHRSAAERLILLPENTSFSSCENLTRILEENGNRIPSSPSFPLMGQNTSSSQAINITLTNMTRDVNTTMNITTPHMTRNPILRNTTKSTSSPTYPSTYPSTIWGNSSNHAVGNVSSPSFNTSPVYLEDSFEQASQQNLSPYSQQDMNASRTASSLEGINTSSIPPLPSLNVGVHHEDGCMNTSLDEVTNSTFPPQTQSTTPPLGEDVSSQEAAQCTIPSRTPPKRSAFHLSTPHTKTLSTFLTNLNASCAPFSFTLPISFLILPNHTYISYDANISFTACPPEPSCKLIVSSESFQTGRIRYTIIANGPYAYYWTLPSGKRISPLRTSRSKHTKYFTPRLSQDSAVLLLHVRRLDCPADIIRKVGWIQLYSLREERHRTISTQKDPFLQENTSSRGNMSGEDARVKKHSEERGMITFHAIGKPRSDGTRRYAINTTCTSCTLYACNATSILPGNHLFRHIPFLIIQENDTFRIIRKERIPLHEDDLHTSRAQPINTSLQQNISHDPSYTVSQNESLSAHPAELKHLKERWHAPYHTFLSGFALRLQSTIQASWQTLLTGIVGFILLLRGLQQSV